MYNYEDEAYDMEAVAFGSNMKPKKRVMTKADKKAKIADHIESFERMASRMSRCKAISAKDKEPIMQDIDSLRSKFAIMYGKK